MTRSNDDFSRNDSLTFGSLGHERSRFFVRRILEVGKMIKRTFGGSARVSVVGVGCSRVGSISNPTQMREIEATLERAIENGINLFDTADIYGQGDSERTLGRLLRRHKDLFVVTKVGGRHGRFAGAARLAKPLLRLVARSRPNVRSAVVTARTATVVHEFSPSDLRDAVEASRRRLGLSQLHGLLLHNPSTKTLASREIHDFLAELLQSEKAKHVGVSVNTLAEVEAAMSIPVLSMIQAPIDVADALPGTAVLETIRQRDIGLFVREILKRPERTGDQEQAQTPGKALASAVAPDFVTAALVGVSTRKHLNELLSTGT
jgi:aryl-alcohol dehydrogenase-like predicted oxidoreductase